MPTSVNVTNLKINELKEAQYDTAVQQGIIGANELSILTDVDAGQVIQVATLPTASADELGNIYQFIGTTDANYTHGYFYECVSDGQQPATYSWSNIQVQAGGGLPTQTGNAGKFLITDGTDASWSNEIPSIVIKGNHNYTFDSFGNHLRVRHTYNNNTTDLFVADKYGNVQCLKHGILGYNGNYLSKVVTQKIGRSDYAATDITIPSVAGSMAVQVSTVPTASSTLEGQIYQFVGTTDSTYTNGHFYKCVSDGQDPATYSWTEVSMGGGSSYTAGTGIDITSGVISVTSPTLQNNAQNGKSAVAIGKGTQENNSGYYSILIDSIGGSNYATGTSSIAIKGSCDGRNNIAIAGKVTGGNQGGIAIGQGATVSAASAIQICSDYNTPVTNSDANTVKIGNANGNFEIMSADGTIPAARHASLPATDGTYVLKLVITSGVPTLSWVAE